MGRAHSRRAAEEASGNARYNNRKNRGRPVSPGAQPPLPAFAHLDEGGGGGAALGRVEVLGMLHPPGGVGGDGVLHVLHNLQGTPRVEGALRGGGPGGKEIDAVSCNSACTARQDMRSAACCACHQRARPPGAVIQTPMASHPTTLPPPQLQPGSAVTWCQAGGHSWSRRCRRAPYSGLAAWASAFSLQAQGAPPLSSDVLFVYSLCGAGLATVAAHDAALTPAFAGFRPCHPSQRHTSCPPLFTQGAGPQQP